MKKKKLLSVSLLCLFGMIVAGCGGKPSSQDTKSASEPESAVSDSAGKSESNPGSSVAPSSSSEAPVNPTGISLDKQTASVIKGQTLQLNATIAPAGAQGEITWSSEDEDVVTVNKTGLVTAVEVGSAKVIAKIKNTSFKAECVVSVIKQINSITIKNKTAFDGFIVDDSESLTIEIDPEDNPTALMNAGALVVTSSNQEVATVSGLTVTALKAGKATIEASLFGKKDSFELNVGDAIPGEPYQILAAFNKAIVEAPFNGKSGKDSAITTTCFELTGKIIALSPSGETGYNAVLDDGTQAVMLQVSVSDADPLTVAVGDYAKVTCKFTNYYGLLEGVSRKAATGKNGSWVPAKDVVKIDAPETPITPFLNAPVAMSDAEYDAYYKLCGTNGTKDDTNATWTSLKYVTLDAEYSESLHNDDKGDYKIADKYGLTAYNSIKLDEPFDGQKCTFDVILLGANTSKSKSNGMPLKQTPLAPTGVVLDQENDTVIVHGNTLQMTYTTTPAGSYSRQVAWESSDVTVATIDNKGLLLGIYEGSGTKSTNVKVTLGEGEGAVVSEVVAIKVFGETVPAESVSLDKTSATVLLGQKLQLTATTVPAMVSDKAVWSSSDDTVASVNQKGLVTGLKDGNAVITVKYSDTVSATCNVTVRTQNLSDLAHAKYGDEVDIYGIVNGKYPVDGKKGLWIADGEFGAYLNHEPKEGMVDGAVVHVVGTVDAYNGSKQISATTYEVVESHAGLTTPTELALDETALAGIDETYQGRLARVTGEVTAHSGSGTGAHHTITLKVGAKSIKVYVHKDNCGATVTGGFDAATVGKTITVTGYVSAYQKNVKDFTLVTSGSYQLINPTLVEVQTIEATGIALNKTTAEVEQGATLQLEASVTPTGADLPGDVTWSVTGNEGVTVSTAGLVTVATDAVAGSTATVKATCGEFEASCVITVKEASGGEVTSLAKYTFSNTANSTAVTDGSTIKGWFSKQSGSDIVSSVSEPSNVYAGANGGSGDNTWSSGNFLKIGKSSAGGSLKISLSQNVKKVIITGYAWKNTLGITINSATVSPALASNLANKANVEANNVGTVEISFSASNTLAISTSATALVITAIEFIG